MFIYLVFACNHGEADFSPRAFASLKHAEAYRAELEDLWDIVLLTEVEVEN